MEQKSEIERLNHELGRRDKAIRDRNRQLVQLKDSAEAARRLWSGYMIQTTLRYGYRQELGGKVYDRCISLPMVDLEQLDGWEMQYLGVDEDGDMVFAAVEKTEEEQKNEMV